MIIPSEAIHIYPSLVGSMRTRVTLGPKEQLLSTSLEAKNVNWFRKPRPNEKLHARIRHRGALHPCTIEGEDPLLVHFEATARAVAPGQAVVVYSGSEVLCGGWIRRRIG